jgi:hypothetical protein
MSIPDEFENPPLDDRPPATTPRQLPRGAVPQPQAEIPPEQAELLAIPGVCGVGEARDSLGGKVLEVYLEQLAFAPRVPPQVRGIPVQTRIVGKITPRAE